MSAALRVRSELPSITIVSGSPGSGKTTLARALAKASEAGLHLASDLFYEFPAHPIDPTTPESEAQNTTIMRALARSSVAFAEGGYDVMLDGVIGPWFLPVFMLEVPPGLELSYVVLGVSKPEALRRVRARQGAGASPAVTHMARAFADLGEWAGHRLEASAAPDTLLEEATRRLAAGEYLVGRASPSDGKQ